MLKTKLSQSANSRLNITHQSNIGLVKDMREKLDAKKSVSDLSMELFSAKYQKK